MQNFDSTNAEEYKSLGAEVVWTQSWMFHGRGHTETNQMLLFTSHSAFTTASTLRNCFNSFTFVFSIFVENRSITRFHINLFLIYLADRKATAVGWIRQTTDTLCMHTCSMRPISITSPSGFQSHNVRDKRWVMHGHALPGCAVSCNNYLENYAKSLDYLGKPKFWLQNTF